MKKTVSAIAAIFAFTTLSACGPVIGNGGDDGSTTTTTTIQAQGIDAPDGTKADWVVIEDSGADYQLKPKGVHFSTTAKVVASSKTSGRATITSKTCTLSSIQLKANTKHRVVISADIDGDGKASSADFGAKSSFNTQASSQTNISFVQTASVDVTTELNAALNISVGGVIL